MQERPAKQVKDVRLVIRVDADFADAMDRLAFRKFEGERSRLVREAIRELMAQYDAEEAQAVA